MTRADLGFHLTSGFLSCVGIAAGGGLLNWGATRGLEIHPIAFALCGGLLTLGCATLILQTWTLIRDIRKAS